MVATDPQGTLAAVKQAYEIPLPGVFEPGFDNRNAANGYTGTYFTGRLDIACTASRTSDIIGVAVSGRQAGSVTDNDQTLALFVYRVTGAGLTAELLGKVNHVGQNRYVQTFGWNKNVAISDDGTAIMLLGAASQVLSTQDGIISESASVFNLRDDALVYVNNQFYCVGAYYPGNDNVVGWGPISTQGVRTLSYAPALTLVPYGYCVSAMASSSTQIVALYKHGNVLSIVLIDVISNTAKAKSVPYPDNMIPTLDVSESAIRVGVGSYANGIRSDVLVTVDRNLNEEPSVVTVASQNVSFDPAAQQYSRIGLLAPNVYRQHPALFSSTSTTVGPGYYGGAASTALTPRAEVDVHPTPQGMNNLSTFSRSALCTTASGYLVALWQWADTWQLYVQNAVGKSSLGVGIAKWTAVVPPPAPLPVLRLGVGVGGASFDFF